MKRKRLLMLLGSLCLTLVLAALLLPACAKAAPEGAAEEAIAALESEIDELEGDVAAKDAEISDLEEEIAELRAPAEVFNWKFQHYWGAGENWLLQPFCDQLEEMSGGRIQVELYSDGGLVPHSELFEALKIGVIDLAFTQAGPWGAVVPAARVEALASFAAGDVMEARVVYDERVDYEGKPIGFGLERIMREQYLEKQGVYAILPHFNDVSGLFLKEPINTLEDLRGRKIFAFPLVAMILEPTGMVTADIAPSEIYTALATGAIDGVVWGGLACGYDMGWQEVTSYFVSPPICGIVCSQFFMTPEKWEALPDGPKTIVEAAIIHSSNYMKTAYTYRETDKRRAMEEQGFEVINLPPEEVRKEKQMVLTVLEDFMQADEGSREAGEVVKDWMRFFGHID